MDFPAMVATLAMVLGAAMAVLVSVRNDVLAALVLSLSPEGTILDMPFAFDAFRCQNALRRTPCCIVCTVQHRHQHRQSAAGPVVSQREDFAYILRSGTYSYVAFLPCAGEHGPNLTVVDCTARRHTVRIPLARFGARPASSGRTFVRDSLPSAGQTAATWFA
jgi:hypothetical protein